ncbi:FMN-binding negative transcriptional regulator [Pedobacter sp. SYSU D00535]|uniref:FMN-binding negative transcriptional regulator n=1 Tax=Pedobacter sp. SYSU D00535 TaxID=2810308 RepID=UPI00351AECAA
MGVTHSVNYNRYLLFQKTVLIKLSEMYISNLNLMTDKTEIIDFMKRFSFATIISAKDNFPIATHLPFIVSARNENIVLTSHFAQANEQWKDLENNIVLVIFSEPHAYISPKHYEKELNVPTWNYISIHAYGQATLITQTEDVFDVLANTIDNYESSYMRQWNSLPQDFKSKMIKGIVSFEIVVTDLQAKKKLSQNRTENERRKIINALSNSADTNEKLISDFMKKEL